MKMKCMNCSHKIAVNYCGYCGQKAVRHVEPTLHDVIHDGIHEFFHLDGKIVQTMKKLMTQPGFLTSEYLNWRRVRYINPIRLYLTMSLIYFLLATFTHSHGLTIKITGDNDAKIEKPEFEKEESNWFTDRITRGFIEMEKNEKAFMDGYARAFPKMLFAMVPLFAGILWLSFWRQRKTYFSYVYFSLHFHSALFTGLLLTIPFSAFENVRENFIRPIWMIWAIFYLAFALKRVWGGTNKEVFLRTISVLFFYCVFFGLGVASLLFYQVYQLGGPA